MHISLDSALGRQRRLNSVGESVLQIAPNAAAAYSLRSLTGGDPKVVRVRRASDNGEQDFTASGVTSGALTSFVNEDVTIYQSDFSAGVNGFVQTITTTATGNQDGVSDSAGTSKDNVLKVVKAADAQGYMQRDQGVVAGLTYTVSGSFLAPSANTSVDGIMIKDGLAGSSLSDYPSGYLVSDGTWKDFSFSYTAAVDGNQRVQLGVSSLGSNPNGSSTGSTGDIVYIADLKFVETISNGFVETWYDQSGNSKDAVQATAGNQPKIVNAGSLVTSSGLASIKFDGTDDNLTADSLASVFSGTDKVWSHFSVTEFNNVDNTPIVANLGSSGTNTPVIYSGISSARKYRLFVRDDSSTNVLLESGALSLNTPYLNHATTNGAAQAQFVNSSAAGTGSTNTGAMTFNRFTLGALGRPSTTSFLNGSISEFIIHNSNQSANRVALETNINSHYSIF